MSVANIVSHYIGHGICAVFRGNYSTCHKKANHNQAYQQGKKYEHLKKRVYAYILLNVMFIRRIYHPV